MKNTKHTKNTKDDDTMTAQEKKEWIASFKKMNKSQLSETFNRLLQK